jgi:hypothetical protein
LQFKVHQASVPCPIPTQASVGVGVEDGVGVALVPPLEPPLLPPEVQSHKSPGQNGGSLLQTRSHHESVAGDVPVHVSTITVGVGVLDVPDEPPDEPGKYERTGGGVTTTTTNKQTKRLKTQYFLQ